MKDRRIRAKLKEREACQYIKNGGGTGFKSQVNDYRLQKFGYQSHSSELNKGNKGGQWLGTREHKERWYRFSK